MLRDAVLVSFVPLLLAGCAVGRPQDCRTITSPAGQELRVRGSSAQWVCCLHHVPLITTRGYTATPGTIVDPDEVEYQASLKLPNFLQAGWVLHRDKFYHVPVTVMYCPRCEEKLQRVRRHERI